jgi:hypothetical protein
MKKIKTISYSLGINKGGSPRTIMTYNIEEGEELKNKVFIDSGYSISLDFKSMKALITSLKDPSDIQVTDIIIEEDEDS